MDTEKLGQTASLHRDLARRICLMHQQRPQAFNAGIKATRITMTAWMRLQVFDYAGETDDIGGHYKGQKTLSHNSFYGYNVKVMVANKPHGQALPTPDYRI